MKVIEFNNVSEKYHIKFIEGHKVYWDEVWALKDVTFDVKRGEILGIIGQNGSGKTTLLKLIAGMLVPDKGYIKIRSKVSALMELGAGFNPEFTGIENIKLNAAIYGLSEDSLKKKMENILEFADLGRFIDAPIKYYSQGMYMRLAFSLAIFVEPDILLIDDILAVGDEETQQKCIKKIFELKNSGKTIILVSHDMNMVSKLCNWVMLLEKGKIVMRGLPEKVISRYLETVGNRKGIAVLEKDKLRVIFNNGRLTINYNGFYLTKPMGGYVSFLSSFSNNWASSSNLLWQIKELRDNGLIVEGRFQEDNISQIWRLWLEDDCLQWQVEMKEKDIKQPHIDLLFIPQYKRWYTLEESKDFPPLISKYNWHDLGLVSCPNAVLGISTLWENQDYPGIILKHQDKSVLFKLFNTGYDQEARVIQYSLNNSSSNTILINLFPRSDKFYTYINMIRQKTHLEREKQKELQKKRSIISDGMLKVFADIEMKAVRIYHNNNEISRFDGLHTSFLIGEKWYNSSSSEWMVTKKGKSLRLKLFWKEFNLVQNWKISLKDGSIHWQGEALYIPPRAFTMFKLGLILSPDYDTFFCGHQQQSFPEGFDKWQDIPLENPKAKYCGVRKKNGFPTFVMKNSAGSRCIVQKGSADYPCRVVQLNILPQKFKERRLSFATRFNFFIEDDLVDEYIRSESQKLIKRQEIELEKRLFREEKQRRFQKSRCTVLNGNLKVFADVDSKTIRCYYNNREITTGDGFHNRFYVLDRQFTLKDAEWHIQKLKRESLVITFYYKPLTFSLIWYLSCYSEDILNVSVKLKVEKPIPSLNLATILELVDNYKRWQSTFEEGLVSIDQYIGNIAPIRMKYNKVSKILFIPESNNMPKIVFSVLSYLERQTLSIYKHKGVHGEGVCINSCVNKAALEGLNAGVHLYFKGKIVFDKRANNIKLIERRLRKDVFKLVEKRGTKFIFDRGRGRFFWRGRELTSGLSLYTSLFSKGIWYDSLQAIWRLKHRDNRSILAEGIWLHIPILQVWKIELLSDNSVLWHIDMHILEKVDIKIEQANIMLSSGYRNWEAVGFTKGEFIDEYTNYYDILPFRFWYGKSNEISALGKDLPRVIFKSDAERLNLRALIENTDSLYQARLLQYQRVNKSSNKRYVQQGIYTYFDGLIKLEPKR